MDKNKKISNLKEEILSHLSPDLTAIRDQILRGNYSEDRLKSMLRQVLTLVNSENFGSYCIVKMEEKLLLLL